MNISVTDNRTITVIINGTEHKLSIKDAEALRDGLVKALPASVPRAEYADIGEFIKRTVNRPSVDAPLWEPNPGFPGYNPNRVWCSINDYPIFQ